MSTIKEKYGIKVVTKSSGMEKGSDVILHIVALHRGKEGQESIRDVVWGFSTDRPDNEFQTEDRCFEDLSPRISIDLAYPEIQNWARKVFYNNEYGIYHIDLDKSRRQYKTLQRLNKALESSEGKKTGSGRESGGEWALRVANALGIRVAVVTVNDVKKPFTCYEENTYCYVPIEEIVGMVDRAMYEVVRKGLGKQAADGQVEKGFLAPVETNKEDVR